MLLGIAFTCRNHVVIYVPTRPWLLTRTLWRVFVLVLFFFSSFFFAGFRLASCVSYCSFVLSLVFFFTRHKRVTLFYVAAITFNFAVLLCHISVCGLFEHVMIAYLCHTPFAVSTMPFMWWICCPRGVYVVGLSVDIDAQYFTSRREIQAYSMKIPKDIASCKYERGASYTSYFLNIDRDYWC